MSAPIAVGAAWVIELTADPTAGAGVDAPAGTFGIRTDSPQLWQKGSGGDTDWTQVGAGGSGDVTGPAGATDNAIARFDLTTGKVIQNSSWTIGDTGTLTHASIVQMATTGTAFLVKVYISPSMFLAHQSAAGTDVAGYNQIWVKSDGSLWVTDASGNDRQAGLLSVTNAWTGGQYQGETAVTSTSNATALGAFKNRYYHNLTENTTIGLPSGLVGGQSFSIRIEADGSSEASWNAAYKFDTNGAPDCSAQDDGDRVIVDCYVESDSSIMAFASPWVEV